ncbi:MAG TPA: MFS transporter [Acetobacteraceae bacterium]|jgi:ACS family glucarate transporter-like MFS transporter|nr:MFS transporter [Acetobacteraceae bacterium]
MPKRSFVALFLFSLTAINYIDRLALSMAAKPVAQEFHLSPVQLGYLFSSYLWAYVLVSIPMGMIVDRFGARRTAAIGITIWSIATACTGAGVNYLMLMASRFVMGGGEAVTNPVGARIVREWFPAAERGTVNAVFNAGAFAGPALSALIVGYLIQAVGWRLAFVAAGAIGLVWLVAWLCWFGPPERVCWLSEDERQIIIAQRGMRAEERADRSGSAGLGALLRTRTLWGLALIGGSDAYCSYLFLSWLPSYLQTARHLSLGTTSLYTAVPYAAAFVISISVAQISDRFLKGSGVDTGRRRFFIAGSSLTAAALIASVPFVDSVPVLLGMIAVAIGCIATNTSQVFALTNDLLPDARNIGKAMGFEVAAANVIGFLSPIVTGYVIDITASFNAAFVIAGCMMLLGASAAVFIANRPMRIAAAPVAVEERSAVRGQPSVK